MSQYSTEPEYTLEESEKTVHMGNLPLYTNRNYFGVVADLEQLEQALALQADTLGKTRSLLHALVLSLQEPE